MNDAAYFSGGRYGPLYIPTTVSRGSDLPNHVDVDATAFQGSYLRDNVRRYIAQKTVVIPKGGALFVLQLNADAPLGQDDVIHSAADMIARDSTISVN